MTDEKYIRNQINYIKREGRAILVDHARISGVFLILLALLVFVFSGFQHPDKWQEVTITLERYETVHTKRTRIDVYDTSGNRYTINRQEGNVKEHLVVGRQYTFTYSDNILYDTIEALQIDQTVYIDHGDSVKNYFSTKAVLGVLIIIWIVFMTAANLLIYYAGTSDRIKRIRKYTNRISDRKNKSK